ncbi:hypothetical protein B0H19DRAFT_1384662, partial [Mycena capillaripes]
MGDSSHTARMAATQTVFRVERDGSSPPQATKTPPMSLPAAEPSDEIVDNFWRRVAELTTRYYDIEHKWICGAEIVAWNCANMQPCEKCMNSKTKRLCVVDDDQPSCRTCREMKIGCDRKPLFVFEMTKDDSFASYDQFIAVFKKRQPGRPIRYGKKSRTRTKINHERPLPASGE